MKGNLFVPILVGVCGLSPPVCAEDVIHLRDSSGPLRGKIIRITAEEIVVDLMHGVTIGLAPSEIDSITRDGVPFSLDEIGVTPSPLVSATPGPEEMEAERGGNRDGPAEFPPGQGGEDTQKPRLRSETEEQFLSVAGRAVRLRRGPSTDFPVVTKLDRGTLARKVSEEGHWYNICISPRLQGWVYGELAQPVSATPCTVTGLRVNLRAEPGLDETVLIQAERETRVYQFGSRGDWSHIWVPGDYFGWMASQYLEPADVQD